MEVIVPPARKKFRIWQGRPSYSQMKKGESFNECVVREFTDEELARHTNNLHYRSCPYRVEPIEE